MTVILPKKNASWVQPLQDHQVQPAGIDLTLEHVFTFSGTGVLEENQKTIPEHVPLQIQNNYYVLEPGTYMIRYNEIIHIPSNAIGLVFPRSSLMRMGGSIDTAVWDPGYQGRGMSLLRVHHPLRLQQNVRIAQLVLFQTETHAKKLYNGSYQHEGIKKQEL